LVEGASVKRKAETVNGKNKKWKRIFFGPERKSQ
jgi:hypothetical protein